MKTAMIILLARASFGRLAVKKYTPTFTPNRRSKTSSWVKTGYPDQQSGGNESRENIGNPTKASLAQW